MSSRAGKRPLRSLSYSEKLSAIRRVHDGESKASVARDIGVPESTLRGWCKNEEKILNMSRQSASPDTDESLESQKSKKARLDDTSMQPFNLSLKNNSGAFSPDSDPGYAPAPDSSKPEPEPSKTTPLNLITRSAEPPKSNKTDHQTEKERNKAELARMSVELGLNRPENFLSQVQTTNLADLNANFGLLAYWNTLLVKQQQQQQMQQAIKTKITSAETSTYTSTQGGLLTTVDREKSKYSTPLSSDQLRDQQLTNDAIWSWLKNQQQWSQNLLSTSNGTTTMPNGTTTSPSHLSVTTTSTNVSLSGGTTTLPTFSSHSNGTTVSVTTTTTRPTPMKSHKIATNGFNAMLPEGSWFWKWMKEADAYGKQVQQFSTPDKPILYQQLTKKDNPGTDQHHNAENVEMNGDKSFVASKSGANTNKEARIALDDLVLNNNGNVVVNKKESKQEEEILTHREAIEYGEKFLKWLETCSEPSVTKMQILQFETLLNNVRMGSERKSGDLRNKTKVKRK
ncbi:hypothetical protein NQ315_007022 [Exocentrus adspersus]|uniref:HTH psq-type domain-containing protein n=1 Tax=Exocentrus adspersus TaxID=1586481 RepID=A0AAV8WD96_9CUCU|nr:hypothetical protein NQ315_007022 [Exocentrus adspersus]